MLLDNHSFRRLHTWGPGSEILAGFAGEEDKKTPCSNLPWLLGDERWLALMIESRRSEVIQLVPSHLSGATSEA